MYYACKIDIHYGMNINITKPTSNITMSKSWHHLPISKHLTTGVVNETLFPCFDSVLLPPDFGTPRDEDGQFIDDGVSTRMDYIINGMKQVVGKFDAIVDSKMSKNGYHLKIETQSGQFMLVQFSRHVCEEFPNDAIYADFMKRGGDGFAFGGLIKDVVGDIRDMWDNL
jgi:hypothetical protein